MENGKLNIRRKDKKCILVITKANGKTLPISDSSLTKPEVWNGIPDGDHEVSFEIEGGSKVTELRIGEKSIKPQASQAPVQSHNRNDKPFNSPYQQSNQANPLKIDTAIAPYNFIPLNEEVLQVDASGIPAFNTCRGFDGFLELEITAKSPIYIRRNLTPDELKTEEELGHNNKSPEAQKFKNSLFGFNRPVGASYRIPGSSLRGMIRSLFEVATYSKMTMLDDHKLHFRSFADKSSEYRNEYSSQMIDNTLGAYRPKVKAGYIKKVGQHYQITEAVAYHRVEEDLVIKRGIINQAMRKDNSKSPSPEYTKLIEKKPFIEVYFKAEPEKDHPHSVKMSYSKVTDIVNITDTPPSGYQKGHLVLSGYIPSNNIGKHMHWVVSEPTTIPPYTIPGDLISAYEKDSNRKSINLLTWAKKVSTPCFFTVAKEKGKDEIKAFGHTGLFRMVYNNSIGDLRPDTHKTDEFDMTEAVFGLIRGKQIRPGRVFFEDAACSIANEFPSAQYPQILSGPKPNTFQHYLLQSKDSVKPDGNNLKGIKNYNSPGARLAGHKLYWHRDHKNWIAREDEVKRHPTQYTMIKPLDTGSVFNGKIRFMNLSAEELGALLFVINLPDGCCHKLGMAKPLGLGSVLIQAKLNLIDRGERYSSLFALGIRNAADTEFLTAFREMLRNKLKLQNDDPWNSDRLKELRRMLDYEHRPDSENTRYMEIEHGKANGVRGTNEYKNRPILKKPSQIR